MASKKVTKKLPSQYIKCSKEDLITLISRMVRSLIAINDKYIGDRTSLSSSNLTRFHSRAPPSISVYDYLIRLSQYNSLENAVLIVSIYYIDLLTNCYKNFNLNSLTVHRFFLTATTVASKGLCDYFCTNLHYSKVGGIKVHELNLLEMEFLERVNWRIIPRSSTEKHTHSRKSAAVESDSESDDEKPVTNKRLKKSVTSSTMPPLKKIISGASVSSGESSSSISSEGSVYGRTEISCYGELLDKYFRKMVELVGSDIGVGMGCDSTVYIL